MPNVSWSRFALALARKPGRTLASRAGELARSWCPSPKAAATWHRPRATSDSPTRPGRATRCSRHDMQAYLATMNTVTRCFPTPSWTGATANGIRFVLDVLTEGLAPSNSPLLSPLAYKALIDTGGRSAARGVRHFAADMAPRRACRRWWNPTRSRSGQTIAATRGGGCAPRVRADSVHAANRQGLPGAAVDGAAGDQQVYVLDISPGRSMIEYFVRQGLQVFAISWRNPTADQRNWDRHLRPGDPERVGDRREDRRIDRTTCRHPVGRDPRRDDGRTSRRDRPRRSAGRVDADGDRARSEQGRIRRGRYR